jgi:putative resolvase
MARAKLARILSDPSASVIVVERQYRLAGFQVEHVHPALATQRRRIVVVDVRETTDHQVGDIIEVLRSTCAYPYRRHGTRKRALRAMSATKLPQPGRAPG